MTAQARLQKKEGDFLADPFVMLRRGDCPPAQAMTP
jgi:hypothetical protein